MNKIHRNSSNFHHFLGVYDPKVPIKSNQWAENVWKTRINSFLGKTCIGCYIPSYLATITNGVLVSPSGTMTLTSGSNQWYERGQETPFDPTAPARPLQSGYSHVYGKLKTSKMAKIETLTPSPPPALKQIFGKTNHVGVFERSLWTLSHREIQINRTFVFCCLVLLS